MKAYLTTIYDKRNSFYSKAVVTDELKRNTISLISYSTTVAEYSVSKGVRTMKIHGYYSPTTARHINEFLLQNGFEKLNKKELEKQPTLTKIIN